MPIHRAKDADEVYSEVKDYDLVITPDAPFASAINRRLDRPQFGSFSTTPRRLAAGRREQAEDRIAFLEVVDETKHDWEAISYAIGNVLQCWEHQGSLDSIFEYDAYINEATRDAVEIMSSLRTTSRQLTDYEVENNQSVAVVGYDQLTNLERSILPPDVDRIELFTDEKFNYPSFHIFESSAEIVNALLDTVNPQNADDVAVVVDSASKYSSLIESAFESAEIPFYGGPGFIDDPHHRAFVRLLRIPFRGSETTVGDVAPVLTQMGLDVPFDDYEKRLASVESSVLDWLHGFCDNIDRRTFDDALNEYTEKTGIELERFGEELDKLGLSEKEITDDYVDQLSYYLETYEVPVDRENEGVLLADAKSSNYVDRPVVFYIGMDQNWTHSAPQRPWVDTQSQFGRYIGGFQRLLQSGSEQYYLVQDSAGGEPVTPCLYFGDLFEDDFERFSDLNSVKHQRIQRSDDSMGGFERNSLNVESETVDTVSQSSLNSYVNSPRDYFFNQLIDLPDQERFVEGNLFHDFAEFYVNHPETIDNTDMDELIDVMITEAEPFFSSADETLRRRKYQIGLENIIEYLDSNSPDSDSFLSSTSGWGSNFFANYFDQPIDSTVTERWFEDSSLGVKGKIDLIESPDHLLDYKSGRKKSEYQVVKRAAVDSPADTPNFQAAVYLTYYRSIQPNKPLDFTFFHFLDTIDDVIEGKANIEDAVTTVSYYPFTFDEYVGSRDAYEELLNGYNDCQETFDDLGYPSYSDIMNQLTFPDTTEKSELRSSEFAEEFTTAVDVGTSEDVDAEKGSDQAIRRLNKIRERTFFREDLDAFEDFVDERLTELNRRRSGDERFPVEGLSGEPNYRRIDNRDLLLEGEKDD
ncbi:PD-(D/E)XK nuclease family protein (plasmid) [Halorutilales archaeon Cl-col2-1]